jgi:hypothetical protein
MKLSTLLLWGTLSFAIFGLAPTTPIAARPFDRHDCTIDVVQGQSNQVKWFTTNPMTSYFVLVASDAFHDGEVQPPKWDPELVEQGMVDGPDAAEAMAKAKELAKGHLKSLSCIAAGIRQIDEHTLDTSDPATEGL